jgi:FKBP-type peptidyl-prolyl cis-trans isomerase 2
MVPYDCLLCITMRWKDFKKDKAGLSKAMLAIIVVVLLLASSSVAVLLTMQGSGSGEAVASGDYVTVNYTGTVLIQGVPKVFDTSLWDVATDNSTYLKTAWFTAKAQSSYTTLSYYASGGTVITGFDQGVLGMKVGETKVIEIPPSQGYGNMVSTKLTTFDINGTAPVFVTTTPAKFLSTFGVSATTGLTVTDPTYKWPITVLNVDTNAGVVLYQNSPTLNALYHIYGSSSASVVAGWNITITSIDTTVNHGEGLIKFTHNISNADSWNIQGYQGTTLFILINVDTATGKAVQNFNSPLVGQTMTFKVTLVALKK